MKRKVYIHTWGCQMNVYDSEKIIDLLTHSYKYEITTDVQRADLILLNTCSIREKPQEKLFHQLGRWKNLKKKNKNLIIGVGGCVAVQEGKNILKRANCVDIIFGPQTLHRIPNMIEQFKYTRNPIIDISFPENEKFEYFPNVTVNKFSASVSIMEGCSKHCTYCVVPYTRGEEFSRPCDDVLFEVFQLIDQGVREIILLGQNVNAYRGLHYDGTICNFSDLIRLISAIDGVQRIRYITSHPAEFTEDLIQTYCDVPQLVNFLHLPVQSGSDRILSMMNRSYSVSEYKSIIFQLKKVRPNIQISSDFIVGFPNETYQDFQKTMDLISEMDFDMSYSFIYSPRPGTFASKIEDNLKLKEKNIRLRLLQERIKMQTMKHTRRMKDTKQNILVEKVIDHHSDLLSGRTENNRIVNFRGSLSMIGKCVDVKITNIYKNILYADLLQS